MNLGEKLKKSRDVFSRKLSTVFRPGVDAETLEEAEEVLLGSDLGWELTEYVLERFKTECRLQGTTAWRKVLKEVLLDIVPNHPVETRGGRPHVTMVVGVNGAGKTTTIARLSGMYLDQGQSVLMACADTYRPPRLNSFHSGGTGLGSPFSPHLRVPTPGR